MYTKETLATEKAEFISLLKSVKREGAQIELLLQRLEESDFYTAPASTKYHNNCEGGLLDHSLSVYKNLKALVKSKGYEDIISEESMIICGLLHDISKANYYEKVFKNKKVYSTDGSKRDEGGYFDWHTVQEYATKPDYQRFQFGSHEQNSEYLVRAYIPLYQEESMAILHHHAGMAYDSVQAHFGIIWERAPLALFLHIADMISSFIDEEINR